jgi:hypothetical protein
MRKIKMTKHTALHSAAALLLGLALAVPAHASPPPWAPAHGYRAKQVPEYPYVYYPAQQVYYAPASGTWFWMNGGNWQVGVNLPVQYHAHIGNGVSVALHSSRPMWNTCMWKNTTDDPGAKSITTSTRKSTERNTKKNTSITSATMAIMMGG